MPSREYQNQQGAFENISLSHLPAALTVFPKENPSTVEVNSKCQQKLVYFNLFQVITNNNRLFLRFLGIKIA